MCGGAGGNNNCLDFIKALSLRGRFLDIFPEIKEKLHSDLDAQPGYFQHIYAWLRDRKFYPIPNCLLNFACTTSIFLFVENIDRGITSF